MWLWGWSFRSFEVWITCGLSTSNSELHWHCHRHHLHYSVCLSVCLPVQTTARPGIIALTDMITSMECSDEWTNAARLSHRNLFCVFCEDFYAFYAALFLFTFDKYCFMLQSVCQSASYREIVSEWVRLVHGQKTKKELFAFRIPKTVQRCYDVAEIVEVGGIVEEAMSLVSFNMPEMRLESYSWKSNKLCPQHVGNNFMVINIVYSLLQFYRQLDRKTAPAILQIR